ncbi:hypothetical protein ACHQM5_022722 [Ranunculus cassubicifolius]
MGTSQNSNHFIEDLTQGPAPQLLYSRSQNQAQPSQSVFLPQHEPTLYNQFDFENISLSYPVEDSASHQVFTSQTLEPHGPARRLYFPK